MAIKSFLHKGIKDLFETGKSSKVPAELRNRCQTRLELLDRARDVRELVLPSYNLHRLRGTERARYPISVSGPWRLTFEFNDGDAWRVDLEEYH